MTELHRMEVSNSGGREERGGTQREEGDGSEEGSDPDRPHVSELVLKRGSVLVYSWNCDGKFGVRRREVGAAQVGGGESNELGTGVDAAATPTPRLDRIITAFEQETRLGAVMLQQTWLTERMFRGMEETLRGPWVPPSIRTRHRRRTRGGRRLRGGRGDHLPT